MELASPEEKISGLAGFIGGFGYISFAGTVMKYYQ